MASVTASTMSIASLSFKHNQAVSGISSLKSVAMPVYGRTFQSLRMSRRFQVSCEATPETVDKVISIVKKQLALTPETVVSGESKFAALGADSLDTVEIVMGLEEEFGISVEEESAQTIATVQDAADLIQKLVEIEEFGISVEEESAPDQDAAELIQTLGLED